MAETIVLQQLISQRALVPETLTIQASKKDQILAQYINLNTSQVNHCATQN